VQEAGDGHRATWGLSEMPFPRLLLLKATSRNRDPTLQSSFR
jgi:hypothetical protein